MTPDSKMLNQTVFVVAAVFAIDAVAVVFVADVEDVVVAVEKAMAVVPSVSEYVAIGVAAADED